MAYRNARMHLATIATMHYLYAIRGTWSPAVKIGHYVADVVELRKRYSTPYGPDLDIRVFEVVSKQYAIIVEKAIHATLKKVGFHIGGELFKTECLDLFCTRASLLCRRYVTLREWRRDRLKQQRLETKRIAAEKAEEERRNRPLEAAAQLGRFIEAQCTVGPKLTSNAAAFLRAFTDYSGASIKQKALKELMAAKGFKYVSSLSSYKGIKMMAT